MDEKDEAIIRVLRQSAKLSSRAVARRVGLPISTVYRRIKRLEQEGVITGYRALINHKKTNKPVGAFVFINLAEVIPGKGHIPKKNIIGELKKLDEVEGLSDVIPPQAANFDLMIRARFTSLKELSKFMEKLRSIEGIEEASSAVIAEEIIPL